MADKKKAIVFGSIGAGILAVVVGVGVAVGLGSKKEPEVVEDDTPSAIDLGGEDNENKSYANGNDLERPTAPEEETEANPEFEKIEQETAQFVVGEITGYWRTPTNEVLNVELKDDNTYTGYCSLYGTYSGAIESDKSTYIKITDESGKVLDLKIVDMGTTIKKMYITVQGPDEETYMLFPYKPYELSDNMKQAVVDNQIENDDAQGVEIGEGDAYYHEAGHEEVPQETEPQPDQPAEQQEVPQ